MTMENIPLTITDPLTGSPAPVADVGRALAQADAYCRLISSDEVFAGLAPAWLGYWQNIAAQLRGLEARQKEEIRQRQAAGADFEYLGQYFRVERKFRPGEVKRLERGGMSSFGISNLKGDAWRTQNHISDAWSHEEFYALAAQTRMPECDVFLMNNEKLVVPGTNLLFELTA